MSKPYYQEVAEREYAKAYGRGRKLMRYSDEPLPGLVEFAGSRYFRDASRVADFACGEGINAHYLTRRGCAVTGFDIAEAAVRTARRLAEEAGIAGAFLVGDVVHAPLASEAFDMVLAIGCLGRLLEEELRRGGLQETFRVLKRGGYLLFQDGILLGEIVRTFPSVLEGLRRKRPEDVPRWLEEEASGHYVPPSQRYETRRGYEDLLESVGYRIVHSHLDVSEHAWGIVIWARKP